MELNIKPRQSHSPEAVVPAAGVWAGQASAASLDDAGILIVEWSFRAGGRRTWVLPSSYDVNLAAGRSMFANHCAAAGLTKAVTSPNKIVGHPVRLDVRTRGGQRSAFIRDVLPPAG